MMERAIASFSAEVGQFGLQKIITENTKKIQNLITRHYVVMCKEKSETPSVSKCAIIQHVLAK